MHPFGIQPDEVGAELTALITLAGFNAEQVSIGAICALAQGHADLGNRDMAGIADCKKILTLPEVFAALQVLVVFNKTENSTAHENVGMGVMICLDLLQAFISPIDAIPAVDHNRVKIQMRLMGMVY
jgi:hypothetical protein